MVDTVTGLVRQAKLKKLRYERVAARRREMLSRLFDSIMHQDQPFALTGLHDSMQESADNATTSLTDLVKYARILFYGGALVAEAGQENTLFRERLISLETCVQSAESLMFAYETAIATRLVKGVDETRIDAGQVAAILGLDGESSQDLAYCAKVLEAANARRPLTPWRPPGH